MVTKDLNYYMSLPYTITLKFVSEVEGEVLDEPCWMATIPDLGCYTFNDDRDVALKELDEVKELWLQSALKLGKSIPEPTPANA